MATTAATPPQISISEPLDPGRFVVGENCGMKMTASIARAASRASQPRPETAPPMTPPTTTAIEP